MATSLVMNSYKNGEHVHQEFKVMPLDLTDLIYAAFRDEDSCDEVSGMTSLMRAVVRQTESFGVILWRKRHQGDELAMRASWFDTGNGPNNRFMLSKLSIEGTCVGKAMQDGYSVCNNLENFPNPNARHPFLVRHGVNKVLTCKIPDGRLDGQGDLLSLYRRGRRSDAPIHCQTTDPDFSSETDLGRLNRICEVLPQLFNATRDQEALRLLDNTSEILRKYKPLSDAHVWRVNLVAMLKEFCLEVQRGFRALEVSVFLRDETLPQKYTCWFTTPGPHRDKVEKREYYADEKHGFSGLALLSGDVIRIRDVKEPESEIAFLRDIYKSFVGHPNEGISKAVDEYFGFSSGEEPPHSLMVTRLASFDGSEVYGFIRCWMAIDGPPNFSRYDESLLQRVANRLSQVMGATLDEHHWDRAMEAASAYLSTKGVSGDLFIDALKLVEQAVPGADWNTVRLHDNQRNELYFYTYPTVDVVGWTKKESDVAMKKRFPICSKVESSIGADVFRTKISEQCRANDPRYDHLFPGIQEIIVAPILDDKNIYGVIDARTKTAFKHGSKGFLELIGKLIGTQHGRLLAEKQKHEAEKVVEEEKFRSAQERVNAERKNLQLDIEKERRAIEAFEDAAHQLKTPLSNARKALELWTLTGQKTQQSHLETMLRRADLASKLINTFADLAAGKPLSLKTMSTQGMEGNLGISKDRLYKMAEMLCQDVRLYSNRSKNLTVDLDDKSFDKHCPVVLLANEDLLTQALYNLLDNAEKYSFKHTTIKCFADTTNSGRFCLVVSNRGVPIQKHEVHEIKGRRHQGAAAKGLTGGSSGLGLYIVDNIMKAHGGSLDIQATRDKDHVTEVRLIFDRDLS